VQAALSQIEQYSRVRIGPLDNRLAIRGDAVDEVAHLLAELLDNATSYSPPESEVWVTGQAMSDRLVLQVVDHGVGLSEQRRAQINAQLTAPAAPELVGVRSMGLIVVSRLAARHGMWVELRAGRHGGTVAEVTIPWSLISRRDTDGPSPGPGPATGRIRTQPRSAPPVTSRSAVPGARTVNGWFRTTLDGVDVKPMWPTSDGERWAAATGRAAADADTAYRDGLPRRVPQPHLVPAPPETTSDGRHRKLDPTAVAAAMAAYARGVAGHRVQPSPNHSTRLELPS
jgi:hypothetical protein